MGRVCKASCITSAQKVTLYNALNIPSAQRAIPLKRRGTSPLRIVLRVAEDLLNRAKFLLSASGSYTTIPVIVQFIR